MSDEPRDATTVRTGGVTTARMDRMTVRVTEPVVKEHTMQVIRRHAAALSLLVGFGALASPALLSHGSLVAPAHAASMATFTPAAFEAARKAGGPILVEVTAPWCPTCRAQKPIISQLLAQPKFAKMAVFSVDFDSQKDALAMLGATVQSTLITYKGGKEVGRSTGITNAEAIAAQLGKSI